MQIHEITINVSEWELLDSGNKRYVIVVQDEKYNLDDLLVFKVKDLVFNGQTIKVNRIFQITFIEHLLNEHSILSIRELKNDDWRF